MGDPLKAGGKTGQNLRTVRCTDAPVKFLLKDMRDFAKTLQYTPDYSLEGADLFKEEVPFGEIWLDPMNGSRCVYGRIIKGILYLCSGPKKFDGPARLPLGKYRIWLDAWISWSQNDDFYGSSESHFTNARWQNWTAPKKLPKEKFWQQISVTLPKQGEEFTFIWIASQRFHWLYRLDRTFELTRKYLNEYQILTKRALTLQEMARVMHTYLYILGKSGTNMGAWLVSGNYEKWVNMMHILYDVAIGTDLWIQGGDTRNFNLLNKIQHLNNLAALIWHYHEEKGWATALKAWSTVLPEEGRVLISLAGPLLAMIPRGFDAAPRAAGGKTYVARNVSPVWGELYSEEIYKRFFAEKRKEWGMSGSPAFPPRPGKTKGIPQILDEARKYTIGTLNGISVFLLTKPDELSLLTSHFEEYFKLLEKDESFEPNCLVRLYEKEMGRLPDVEEGRALAEVRKQLDDMGRKIDKLALKQRPTWMTEQVARTNPCAIYLLEVLEVGMKGWLVAVAYQKLVTEARQGKNIARNFSEAVGKTSSFVGAGLKSTMLKNALRARTLSESSITKLTGWGKGLSFAGEAVGAGLYIYDTWGKDDSLQQEVAQYTDRDAFAIEEFHIMVAGGKVITAVGAGLTMTVGLAPLGVCLQGGGYAFQFTGEFLIELYRVGAIEKKVWQDMVEQLGTLHNILLGDGVATRYAISFLKPEGYQYLKSMVDDFKWLNIDDTMWRNYVNSFSVS